MILLNYVNGACASDRTGSEPPVFASPVCASNARAAWRSGSYYVDVARAYQADCAFRGLEVDPQTLQALCTLDGMLDAGMAADGWSWLEALEVRWLQMYADAYPAAQACVVPATDAKVTMPLTPGTFRDFYAFLAHVKSCRQRRGLEMVAEWYDIPVFYISNPRSFVGPDVPVYAPLDCDELDFELELACVIGKSGMNISVDAADSFIAGYVILNDWSARDIQRHEVKVGLGPAKGKDFATSFGPYFVTPSELADVVQPSPRGQRHNLEMSARVNGRTVSVGNARDIHYTFAEMIARASTDVVLYPRDVIGSGTVGTGCILELGADQVPWLLPDDVVELEVERLGVLRTSITVRPTSKER